MIRSAFFIISIGLSTALTGLSAVADSPSVLVQTAQATQRQVSDSLSVYGRVAPDPDAVLTLSMPHAGSITRVAVRLGQRIRRNAKLLEISTSPSAHMEFLQAHNAVDYAQRELERQERLLKEQLATRAQVDNARKALADARSTLQSIRAQGADKDLEWLAAPADGIVTALNVNQGDRVQADAAVLSIASADRLIAVLGVEPEDLNRLESQAKVRLHSVFTPDLTAETHLSNVHAMVDPQSRLVHVLAPIPADQAPRFIIGSYLKADIERDPHSGITVPRSAVLQDADGSYVFGLNGNRARRIAVSTGVEGDHWIEVTSGLKTGDTLVVSGNYELSDGQAVRGVR
jgi:RND family efflux transporter MFP subunit